VPPSPSLASTWLASPWSKQPSSQAMTFLLASSLSQSSSARLSSPASWLWKARPSSQPSQSAHDLPQPPAPSQRGLFSSASFLLSAQEWPPWTLRVWLVMLWWFWLVRPCGRLSLACRLRVISPWLNVLNVITVSLVERETRRSKEECVRSKQWECGNVLQRNQTSECGMHPDWAAPRKR